MNYKIRLFFIAVSFVFFGANAMEERSRFQEKLKNEDDYLVTDLDKYYLKLAQSMAQSIRKMEDESVVIYDRKLNKLERDFDYFSSSVQNDGIRQEIEFLKKDTVKRYPFTAETRIRGGYVKSIEIEEEKYPEGNF